jgi:hypothetical protein
MTILPVIDPECFHINCNSLISTNFSDLSRWRSLLLFAFVWHFLKARLFSFIASSFSRHHAYRRYSIICCVSKIFCCHILCTVDIWELQARTTDVLYLF